MRFSNSRALATVLLLAAPPGAMPAGDHLQIFAPEQPMSFFFRETESAAALRRLTYEEWSERYGRLAGVMGKMLDEEIAGRSAAQPYYRRFKSDHPDQAVLLHANGTFRSPKADNRAFHAGHWLYYNGTRVLDALPETGGTVTLRVANAASFERSPYRVNPDMREDVGLCAMRPDGRPDWNRAEQAMLVAVDGRNGTITVQRGVYGSKPLAYAAGRAYAAAHVAQTWGTTNKLWQFNMATTCPRDAGGKMAADVWAAELASAMRPGGAIGFVDGVEFDVPFRRPMQLGRQRQADCDADGRPDNGIVDGVPVFAAGVDRFFRTLRAALSDKLIMADVGDNQQRSVGTLNGVETEGWPKLRDLEFLAWSTALNNHRYWNAAARPPVFTYGLLKFRGLENVPNSAVRLALAGPLLVDAAAPMDYGPPAGSNGVWDELLGGTLAQRGWLGRPLGPTRWLAEETTDLLTGRKLDDLVHVSEAQLSRSGGAVTVAATDRTAASFTIRISGLRMVAKSDLVVCVDATAELSPREHPDAYRMLSVAAVPAGTTPRSFTGLPASPVAGKPFRGRFYFRDLEPGVHDVLIQAEGAEPVSIRAISAHAAADRAVREYERGVIVANPSYREQAFALPTLFPDVSLQRLQATVGQDPTVNNGARVSDSLVVPPKDALFLLKTAARAGDRR